MTKLVFRENKQNFRDRDLRQRHIQNPVKYLRWSILQKQLTAKIVSQKASSDMFDRALNTPLSDVTRGLQSGKIYVNYQKRKLLWINFLSTILWTLSKVISQDIWGKIFPLSSICLTSDVAFPFAILCGSLFVISTTDVQTTCFLYLNNRDWYFHLVPNCKFREQTSAKKYHPSETDNLCAKTNLPMMIKVTN